MSYEYQLIRIPPGYAAADDGRLGKEFRDMLAYLAETGYRLAAAHTGVAFMERPAPALEESAVTEAATNTPPVEPESEPDIEDPAAWEDVHEFYSDPSGTAETEEDK